MENKNNIALYAVIFLVVGIFLGWLIWGSCNKGGMMASNTMHPMSDRHMSNDSTDMASMMSDMNASLEGKKGDAFDKAFIDEMIVHHQGAVQMAELALTNAKHEEIKTMANDIISAQTKEIEQMKQWKSAWYK